MKKSLKYLPQHKRDELKLIVHRIREFVKQAQMIILYGSYARGDYKEKKDLAPDRKSGHVSDYD
ncbi:MAG: nucleotidyltransferase domain-containing protein, partial [Planctomycetota bacterium]